MDYPIRFDNIDNLKNWLTGIKGGLLEINKSFEDVYFLICVEANKKYSYDIVRFDYSENMFLPDTWWLLDDFRPEIITTISSKRQLKKDYNLSTEDLLKLEKCIVGKSLYTLKNYSERNELEFPNNITFIENMPIWKAIQLFLLREKKKYKEEELENLNIHEKEFVTQNRSYVIILKNGGKLDSDE